MIITDLPPRMQQNLSNVPQKGDNCSQFHDKLNLAAFSRVFPTFSPSSTHVLPTFYPRSFATLTSRKRGVA